MKITIFYEEDEKLQEKRKIDHLISLYNAQEVFIEDENSNTINLHKANIETLKFAITKAKRHKKTDFNDTFIKLLNIRLNRLIEIQKGSTERLRKLYKNGKLKWMDKPFNKLISEMNIGLLNANLTRLKEGYYTAECNNLDSVWIKILEKELKVKEQAKDMKSRIWPSSVGPIHVERMTNPHINNCIKNLENKTEKGSFERNWLAIFYDELLRRVTVDEQTKKERADKNWEAYNNRDLTVKTCGGDIFVQDLSVKQLNFNIRELKDVTMVSILKKELETRNTTCLDDYDNDKLYLYGRNVSYMNLINVSDGIDTIEKNPEDYLENLLKCMKHRKKVLLFNHREYEAIKADLVDLSSYGLERLKELYGEIKCSNDPIERKLCGLYAKAIIIAEEKKEIGDNMMKRYNAGELTFAYTSVDGKPGTSYIQDMHLEDIVNARLTTSGRDYHPAWKKIFALEFEKRIQQRELLNIIRTFRI